MKVSEDSPQLVEELRRLRRQVSELAERVRLLETDAPSAAPPPEEREGDFGPAVNRSAPVKHRSAVNKALTMLGVLPPEAETKQSKELTASHKRALDRMRRMGGGEAEPEPGPEQEAAPAGPATAPANEEQAASEFVPLPDLREEERPVSEAPVESEPVALDTALSIDLEHPHSRARDLLWLLVHTLVVCAAMIALPTHVGVVAAVAFIAALSAPHRPVRRAHARFLSLVVLARCLFPDVWAVDTPLRLPAMIVACLPAFAVTFAGRVGWLVQAAGMSAVAAVLAFSQGARFSQAAAIGVGVLAAAVVWRRV